MRSAVEIGSSAGGAAARGRDLGGIGGDHALGAPVVEIGERAGAAAEQHERQRRNPRQERHDEHHRAGHAERLRVTGELLQQRLVGRTGHAGLGDEQARRGRDDQRGDLRDQAVADREQRVGPAGLAEASALAARCR